MGMTKAKVEFALVMGRYTEASIWHVERLLRLAQSHQTLQVAHCNGTCPWCKGDSCHKELRIERDIRAVVTGDTEPYRPGLGNGVDVLFQGDPRGYTVKLIIKSGTPDAFELGVPSVG